VIRGGARRAAMGVTSPATDFHGAQHGAAVAYQADIDGEFGAAGGEFAGAVQRVHQPIHGAGSGDAAGRYLLLGDHRDVRAGPQAIHDDGFGAGVGQGDRGVVGFGLDGESGGADGENFRGGGAGEADREGEKGVIIHGQSLAYTGQAC
jgi:hypothetical protein